MKCKRACLLFWIAIGISAFVTNLWAFWGIIENFHEGWYYEGILQNIFLMFRQYLLVPLSLSILSVFSIRWNKLGSVFHIMLAIGSYIFFGTTRAGLILIVFPLLLLALMYWFSQSEKKKIAYLLVFFIPMGQIILFGGYHYARVSQRFNDNIIESREIYGNNLTLTWAPEGPGWPDNGTTWEEAKRICAHLDITGKVVMDNAQNIWRLPTVDEAVRSLVFHGKNAKGVWDPVLNKAEYQYQPDKESPLWNVYKKTIYWWTSTEINDDEAYIVVYNGGVWPRNKKLRVAYLNFRAVKK